MTSAEPPRAPTRSATIEDVAQRAGVSVATVSRALRGLANVAPSTRARVEEAAAELRYRPDPNASRLAAGRTGAIGVAVPSLGGWYFSQVLSGVEAVLAPAGYDLLVYAAAGPEDRRRFLSDALPVQKRVDGLILVDIPLPEPDVEVWAASGVCVVTVGQRTEPFASVTVDDRAGAAAGTRHLVELGHREIALIGGPDEDSFHFTVPTQRREGFDEALAAGGLRVRPEHVVVGRFTVEGGRGAVEELLAAPVPPTAVFAASDEMAIGAMGRLRELALAVPGDLSVVGFDDHDLAGAIGLTTIRQPAVDIGGRAATLLLEEMAAGGPGGDHVVMPTALVIRGSTGPPGGDPAG